MSNGVARWTTENSCCVALILFVKSLARFRNALTHLLTFNKLRRISQETQEKLKLWACWMLTIALCCCSREASRCASAKLFPLTLKGCSDKLIYLFAFCRPTWSRNFDYATPGQYWIDRYAKLCHLKTSISSNSITLSNNITLKVLLKRESPIETDVYSNFELVIEWWEWTKLQTAYEMFL